MQSVVYGKHGLILSTDAVDKNNDSYQFANQVNKADSILKEKYKAACADSGYTTTGECTKSK